MGKYDISFKDLISGAEKELLKLIGLDVSGLRELNVEFTSVKEKRVDKIFECSIGLQKAIVQIEIQLYYEKQFPVRMSGYWSDLKLTFPDLPIIQIVLTCGKKVKDSIEEEMKIKSNVGEFSFGYMKFKYTVFDLCEIPFQRFLESDNPNINSFGILSSDCNVQLLIQKILDYKLEKEQTASLITKIYILSKLKRSEGKKSYGGKTKNRSDGI
ncbi:MAG: hypothetical protein NZ927_06875 [Candidatus Calescibacterium sp.]|nr:hypothetical protein [Candidatus Calescibacterium sp.]MDW8087645.1 hypothetical protein [Candidatus Calescibacterium sp.]